MQRSYIAFLLSAAVFVQSCRSAEFSSGPETRTRVEGTNRDSGSNPSDDKSKLLSQDEAKGMYAPAGGKTGSGLPSQSSDPNEQNAAKDQETTNNSSPNQNGKKNVVEQNDDEDRKDRDDNKKKDSHSNNSKKSNGNDDKKKSSKHRSGATPWAFIIAAAAGAVIIGAFVINSNGDCRANNEEQAPYQNSYARMHLSPEQLVDDAIQGESSAPAGRFVTLGSPSEYQLTISLKLVLMVES